MQRKKYGAAGVRGYIRVRIRTATMEIPVQGLATPSTPWPKFLMLREGCTPARR